MSTANEGRDLALLSRDGEIAIVTLNAPEKRNAYSMELRQALLARVSEAMQEEETRALVLTGAGGNFCVGGDVGQMKRRDLLIKRQHMDYSQRIVRTLVNGPKAVVAAVEGYAYGVGLSLVAACNYVVADPRAKFCSAFIRVGVMPDGGLLWTLPRKIPPGKAEELIMLGTEFDVSEAARLGLVNRVSEPGAALNTAIEVARQFAAKAPIATAFTKAALGSGSTTLERTFQTEIAGQPVLTQTQDHLEAVAAFKDKRKPVFKGA